MVPLRNGMGQKDMRSIRSNQSSQGIVIELLSDKVPMPTLGKGESRGRTQSFRMCCSWGWEVPVCVLK